MDPLSVTASIVGLVSAAGKVTSLLYRFVSSVKDAPSLARHVMGEVHAINSIFCSFQVFLWGDAQIPKSREALIMVEHLIIILTGCVCTFSELEAELDGLNPENGMATFDRVKWAHKEETISLLLVRLQTHKSSLHLMLTILGSNSQAKAERSYEKLCILFTQQMQNQNEMSERIKRLEGTLAGSVLNKSSNPASIRIPQEPPVIPHVDLENKHFSFDFDLKVSRVYRRFSSLRRRPSKVSRSNSVTAQSTGFSSAFTGLSLGDISHISVLSLPIYSFEISNSQHYHFGTNLQGGSNITTDNGSIKTTQNTQVNDHVVTGPPRDGRPIKPSPSTTRVGLYSDFSSGSDINREHMFLESSSPKIIPPPNPPGTNGLNVLKDGEVLQPNTEVVAPLRISKVPKPAVAFFMGDINHPDPDIGPFTRPPRRNQSIKSLRNPFAEHPRDVGREAEVMFNKLMELPEHVKRQVMAYPTKMDRDLADRDRQAKFLAEGYRGIVRVVEKTLLDLHENSPEWYVKRILDCTLTSKGFGTLSVSLRTIPISWVQDFIEAQGQTALTIALRGVNNHAGKASAGSSTILDREHDIIKCLKVLMNNKYGADDALESPYCVPALTASLVSPRLATRKLVSEALTFLCYWKRPHGHIKVLTALGPSEGVGFKCWLELVEATIDGRGKPKSLMGSNGGIYFGVERPVIEYALTTLSLIDIIACGTDDLQARVHIRAQIEACGFAGVALKMKEFQSELINKQINEYEDKAAADLDKLIGRDLGSITDNIKPDPKDLNDLSAIVDAIEKQIQEYEDVANTDPKKPIG